MLAFDVGIVKDKKNNFLTVHFLRVDKNFLIDRYDVQEFDITQTGDRFENKICDSCYKFLNTEKYFENNRLKNGDVITKRPSCRSCRKQKNGKNISAEERQLWERPKDYSLFTCPICRKTTIVKITKVVLDHNHHTGKVRGWLCESCNTGIGRFDDNPDLVERAKEWLNNK